MPCSSLCTVLWSSPHAVLLRFLSSNINTCLQCFIPTYATWRILITKHWCYIIFSKLQFIVTSGSAPLPQTWYYPINAKGSSAVKWLGHEGDHSPLSNAKVKHAWSPTSTPPYASMAWCLIKRHWHDLCPEFCKLVPKVIWHANCFSNSSEGTVIICEEIVKFIYSPWLYSFT